MFVHAQDAGAQGLRRSGTRREANRAGPSGHAGEDTYWGYVIRSTERTPFLVDLAQGVALVVGVGLQIATLGLWLLPESLTGGDVLGMKVAASTILTLAGWSLVWFASRGTRSEVQVDTRLAEVREVVRNRIGRPTLLSRHGFDVVSEVDFEQVEDGAPARRPGILVIRGVEQADLVRVATGSREALDRLRQRLGRDLMVATPPGHEAPYDARGALLRVA